MKPLFEILSFNIQDSGLNLDLYLIHLQELASPVYYYLKANYQLLNPIVLHREVNDLQKQIQIFFLEVFYSN